MKIDLVGPERRGLAMGFNEAAGYLAVAATAMTTGAIAEQSSMAQELVDGLTREILELPDEADQVEAEIRTHFGA